MARIPSAHVKQPAFIATALMAGLLALVLGFWFHWTINRFYVPVGKSLLLRYKGPLVFGNLIGHSPTAGKTARTGPPFLLPYLV
jgi:hypothetical protein